MEGQNTIGKKDTDMLGVVWVRKNIYLGWVWREYRETIRLDTLGLMESDPWSGKEPTLTTSERATKRIIRGDYYSKGVFTLGGGCRTMVDNRPRNRHCKQHKFPNSPPGESSLLCG